MAASLPVIAGAHPVAKGKGGSNRKGSLEHVQSVYTRTDGRTAAYPKEETNGSKPWHEVLRERQQAPDRDHSVEGMFRSASSSTLLLARVGDTNPRSPSAKQLARLSPSRRRPRGRLQVGETFFNPAMTQPFSEYRGVDWHRGKKQWRAWIFHEEKEVELGMFDDEEAAAESYDHAASMLKGIGAPMNLCPGSPSRQTTPTIKNWLAPPPAIARERKDKTTRTAHVPRLADCSHRAVRVGLRSTRRELLARRDSSPERGHTPRAQRPAHEPLWMHMAALVLTALQLRKVRDHARYRREASALQRMLSRRWVARSLARCTMLGVRIRRQLKDGSLFHSLPLTFVTKLRIGRRRRAVDLLKKFLHNQVL
jgi:hypothetical protein